MLTLEDGLAACRLLEIDLFNAYAELYNAAAAAGLRFDGPPVSPASAIFWLLDKAVGAAAPTRFPDAEAQALKDAQERARMAYDLCFNSILSQSKEERIVKIVRRHRAGGGRHDPHNPLPDVELE